MGLQHQEETISFWQMILVYVGYLMMYICGHGHELYAKMIVRLTGKPNDIALARAPREVCCMTVL